MAIVNRILFLIFKAVLHGLISHLRPAVEYEQINKAPRSILNSF